MLKGLIIRQGFVVLDLGLAVLAVVVAFFIVGEIGDQRNLAMSLGEAEVEEGPSLDVAEVGPLAKYMDIANSGMFGKAGTRTDKEPPKPAAPPPPKEEKTTLPLKLRGAISAGPEDDLANAVIENTRTKVTDTFYIGQPVMEDVTLAEVRRRSVILFNKATNTREILEMEEQTGPQLASAPARPIPTSPVSRPTPRSSGVVIPRHEVAQQLSTENVANLVTTVAPELYQDENGNVAGITSNNISSIPLAKKMGLQDGDVLQAVNGIKIDSQDKIPEIVQKFGNLNVFRLSILRNGNPQVITFRLE